MCRSHRQILKTQHRYQICRPHRQILKIKRLRLLLRE
ncbi:hypothetical protein [Microcoleus sp. C2C6]